MKEFLKVAGLSTLVAAWLLVIGRTRDELDPIFYILIISPPFFVIISLAEFYFKNRTKPKNAFTALGFLLTCASRGKSAEYSDSTGTYLIKKIK